MNKILGLMALTGMMLVGSNMSIPVAAQTQRSLYLAYPPEDHETAAKRIFFIGTAPPQGQVLVNGKSIQRSRAGHFAPSFPLEMGENIFTLRYQDREIEVKVTRIFTEPEIPDGVEFAKDSLTPNRDIARLPDELMCFSAVAPPNANVLVRLGYRTIPLRPQTQTVQLPPNSAIYTADNQPTASQIARYKGCTALSRVGNLGNPLFQLRLNGETVTQKSPGTLEILSPTRLDVIEVTAEAGIARTGPSTNYSRLTPLPKGTRASVTGKEGEWLRLDYGAWIKEDETKLLPTRIPPQSIIRSVTSRQVDGATEIVFPLQTPVPVSVQQADKTLTLTLHNTTAQTDTIRLDDNPSIARLDWQQVKPTQLQYTFTLKHQQQWGYDLRYEGTSLILSLQHPPTVLRSRYGNLRYRNNRISGVSRTARSTRPLSGIKILLDPGHGGEELGAKGPTGYPEKDVNLVVSKLLQAELVRRGAIVYLTRESDKNVSLQERVDKINKLKPAIALSIHYNALPDSGDAINTSGVSTFWYNPQAHNLAVFLHNYLVKKLNRPSYGVFWNNLALTRPHTSVSVLLELGFMINPEEFEWIINPQQQKRLVSAIADGVTEWLTLVE